MKLIYLILFFIVVVSGCLGSRYVPEATLTPSPLAHVTPRANQTPPQMTPLAQQLSTATPSKTTYNLTISNLEYVAGNSSIIFEFPLNGSSTLTCNATKYAPYSIDTVRSIKQTNVTLYSFTVRCAPRAKGVIVVSGYTQNIVIPNVSQTWHFEVTP